MNIPAMPSRNSGLAERNITEDHHRLESCTKTDGRSRAEGTLSRNDPLIWRPNHWTIVQPRPLRYAVTRVLHRHVERSRPLLEHYGRGVRSAVAQLTHRCVQRDDIRDVV
jgi:hypothetical protein